MTIFKMIEGLMHTAEVPPGALLLEVGSAANPDGGDDLSPIEAVDRTTRNYRREDGSEHSFPSRTIEYRDIAWSVHP